MSKTFRAVSDLKNPTKKQVASELLDTLLAVKVATGEDKLSLNIQKMENGLPSKFSWQASGQDKNVVLQYASFNEEEIVEEFYRNRALLSFLRVEKSVTRGRNFVSVVTTGQEDHEAYFPCASIHEDVRFIQDEQEDLESLTVRNLKIKANNLGSRLNKYLYTSSNLINEGEMSVNGLDRAIQEDETYGAIDRTYESNAFWKSNVSVGPLTLHEIRDDRSNIFEKCGERPDLMAVSPKTFQRITELFSTLKHYVVESSRETKALCIQFEGMTIFEDIDCPNDRVYYLNSRFVSLKYILPVPNPTAVVIEQKGKLPLMVSEMARVSLHQYFNLSTVLFQLVVERPNSCGMRLI